MTVEMTSEPPANSSQSQKRLTAFADSVTSQHGEDGMIAEVARRLGITEGHCVEFGAWDGRHLSNTWRLWHEEGWRALLIEGDAKKAAFLSETTATNRHVQVMNTFVRHEGPSRLDALLLTAGFPRDFDVLSVDIDGDDYHVWDGLTEFFPKLVVIEYNSSFPAGFDYVQDLGDHVGASASAMYDLGLKKGYALLAALPTNLVFLRRDLLHATRFDEISVDECAAVSSTPIVYSDYFGTHHLAAIGPWGYTGMRTHQSELRALYRSVGKRIYRRFGHLRIVSATARRLERPGDATPD